MYVQEIQLVRSRHGHAKRWTICLDALAKQASLNILGATSSDTGSAARYAMRDRQGVRFMLSPHEKMSLFQTAQMFSLQDPNIFFNLAVRGAFDDCRDIVRPCPTTTPSRLNYKIGVGELHQLGACGGPGGVPLQRAILPPRQSNDQHVSFSVPSGNFGNVCAAHIARMMGPRRFAS